MTADREKMRTRTIRVRNNQYYGHIRIYMYNMYIKRCIINDENSGKCQVLSNI